ncbi:hypothetical protein SAMN05421788_111155 [Filimonas lacunae]|uniref:Uncharacterized protein n=1 Tax=Filimonas lacunae TaxID=477680 RepID=A0A173MAU1_9BACT|nr:hypothetical protein [Filimonas lacunae]BAV04647.1 hypothetical protein FLA_0639 [Filimonas lacunae]SIT32511.1 hypothetical protein SAMN05421788_111155 [Filimonas lacunae]
MSLYPVLNPRIVYTTLPESYPLLGFSGGNVYQPAAYTEGNEDKASYTILLPIPGGIMVSLPQEIVFDPVYKKFYCTLTLYPDLNAQEMRLAMISFTVDPSELLVVSNPIEISVSQYEADPIVSQAGNDDGVGGGRLVGKVVMDSNIIPN